MASRANIKATVSADTTQFSTAMRRAQIAAGEAAKRIGSSVGSAAASVAKMGAAAAAAGAAVAASAAGLALFKGVKLAATAEQTAVAFEVLTGSAETAGEVLGELKKLGAETPFEFPELADAGRKLIAFGESTGTVSESLRRIGDIASGVGAPIGDIAEIYGKARVAGRLFAEDINQLTGRGIPIIQELAKQFAVSDSEVKKLVEDGKIGFPELEKAFVSLTSEGGKFFGMMEKQSRTTLGLWSTLVDNFNDFLTRIGAPINDAIKPMLERAIELLGTMGPIADQIGEKIAGVIDSIMGMIDTMNLGEIFEFAGLVLKNTLIEAVNILAKGIQATIKMFKSGDMGQAFEIAGLQLRQSLALAAADLLESLEPILGKRATVAADYQRATADLIDAQIEAIRAGDTSGKGFAEKFKEEFDKAGGILKMPEDDMARLDEFTKRISEGAKKYEERRKGQAQKDERVGKVFSEQRDRIKSPADNWNPFNYRPTAKIQIDGSTYGPVQKVAKSPTFAPSDPLMSPNDEIAQLLLKRGNEELAEGFRGLAERSFNQANMVSGIGPGVNKRRYIGIAGGSSRWAGVAGQDVTGGVGEKRRLRTSKDDRADRKRESLEQKRTQSLENIENNIKQAITVG